MSDHWGKVATCKWLLEGKHIQGLLCGECYYDDFRSMMTLYDPTERPGCPSVLIVTAPVKIVDDFGAGLVMIE